MALPHESNNIGIELVAQTLGVTNWKRNHVGWLCIDPAVNMWSKWKPIIKNGVEPLLYEDLENANFGLVPPSPSNNYANIVNVRWTYQKPTGGATSPHRLDDFRNYNHGASAIAEVEGDIEINKSNITKRPVVLMANISGSDLLIGINDFIDDIGAYYYGVVFKRGNNVYIKTSSNTLASTTGGYEFEVFMNEPPFTLIGDIEAYHILSQTKVETMTSLAGSGAVNFLSIPSDTNNIQIIKQKTGADFSMDIKSIGLSKVTANSDINTYMGIDSPAFVTSGNIYLKIDLVNRTDDDNVFASTNLKLKANPNYFGISSYVANAGLFDSMGNVISSILVPANQIKTVVIGVNDLVNRDGVQRATPPPNTEIYSTIQINRGTDRLVSTSLKLKSS